MRNQVYRLVLIEPIGAVTIINKQNDRNKLPALLQTCHQLRSEASDLYNSSNNLHFNAYQQSYATITGDPIAWLSTTSMRNPILIPAFKLIPREIPY